MRRCRTIDVAAATVTGPEGASPFTTGADGGIEFAAGGAAITCHALDGDGMDCVEERSGAVAVERWVATDYPADKPGCEAWKGVAEPPAGLRLVTCSPRRMFGTGKGDLLEACGAFEAQFRRNGWVEGEKLPKPEGTMLYPLQKGEARLVVSCREAMDGVVVGVDTR
jgi:hypothetical protein